MASDIAEITEKIKQILSLDKHKNAIQNDSLKVSNNNFFIYVKNLTQNPYLNLRNEIRREFDYGKTTTIDSPREKKFNFNFNNVTFTVTFTDLSNVQEEKTSYNKGNAAEGILGAAISARFINKTQNITEQNVINILNDIKKSNTTFKTWQSQNKQLDIFDTVSLTINLSQNDMNFILLQNQINLTTATKDRKLLITPCVQYANSFQIKKLAENMYQNGRKDTIEIIADGITEQKTSKIDVKLIINGFVDVVRGNRTLDGKTITIPQISLKVDVNQFSQVGGWEIHSIDHFWGKLLKTSLKDDVEIKNIYQQETQYKDKKDMKFYHIAIVMKDIYEILGKRLEKQFNNVPSYSNNFIDILNSLATGGSNNVEIVDLKPKKSTYKKLDFLKLKNILNYFKQQGKEVKFITSYEETNSKSGKPEEKLPKIKVFVEIDGKQYGIVQFRHKIEWQKGTTRNLVEKQNEIYDIYDLYENAIKSEQQE